MGSRGLVLQGQAVISARRLRARGLVPSNLSSSAVKGGSSSLFGWSPGAKRTQGDGKGLLSRGLQSGLGNGARRLDIPGPVRRALEMAHVKLLARCVASIRGRQKQPPLVSGQLSSQTAQPCACLFPERWLCSSRPGPGALWAVHLPGFLCPRQAKP